MGARLLPRNSNTPNSVCEINNGMYTLKFQSVCEIADFGDVFKFYAYFVNNRLFLTTARLVGDCLT